MSDIKWTTSQARDFVVAGTHYFVEGTQARIKHPPILDHANTVIVSLADQLDVLTNNSMGDLEKLMDVMRNGMDEDMWPPGTDIIAAVVAEMTRLIRENNELRDAMSKLADAYSMDYGSDLGPLQKYTGSHTNEIWQSALSIVKVNP